MSDLRRALTRAVTPATSPVKLVDPEAIVDAVIECLIHEPLMVVLSGLSEEVLASRARDHKPSSNFRA